MSRGRFSRQSCRPAPGREATAPPVRPASRVTGLCGRLSRPQSNKCHGLVLARGCRRMLKVATVPGMRVRAGIAAFLLLAAAARAQQPTEPNPRDLFNALNALGVSPKDVYSVKDLSLHRGALHISLGPGKLAFFSPCDGRVTGAVFAGGGHVLSLVRDPVQRLPLYRFLCAPVLDQHFFSAIFRSTDNTAEQLPELMPLAGNLPAS